MIKTVAEINTPLAKNDGAGVEAYFFKQGERGIKIYPSRHRAYAACKTQTLAYEKHVGPKVLAFGRILNKATGFRHWGYVTEVAEMSFRPWDHSLFKDMIMRSAEYCTMIEKLETIGIARYDMGRANVGVLYDARLRTSCLVCVDFGSDSRSSETGEIRKTKRSKT